MAHQDYSEICPIFNEGVENELQIGPIAGSISVGMDIIWPPVGREIEVLEAYVQPLTASLSAEAIFNVMKFTAAGGSTEIASVSVSTTISTTLKWQGSGGISLTSFTSTDRVGVRIGAKNASTETYNVIVRYRDK